MARPKSGVDETIMGLLADSTGDEIHYPATMRTLYTVRNAVYRFNKANNRKFRCVIRDDGVLLTERPMQTTHDQAIKDVTNVLRDAKSQGESDVEVLTERIRDVLTRHFDEASDTDGQLRRRA